MSGFGTELLLFCGLGYVILGPQRAHPDSALCNRGRDAFPIEALRYE
jgi:hypothetical protein